MTPSITQYAKEFDDSWVIKSNKDWKVGEIVLVHTKAGGDKKERVGELIRTKQVNDTLWYYFQILRRPTVPRPATPPPGNIPSAEPEKKSPELWVKFLIAMGAAKAATLTVPNARRLFDIYVSEGNLVLIANMPVENLVSMSKSPAP